MVQTHRMREGNDYKMSNFGIIYRYEMKKLIKRKIVWISSIFTLINVLIFVCAEVTGKYYVDGVVYDTHYHMMETDREYARALSGRAIDRKLIDEMQEAYRKVPADALRYSLTDEYQTYARPYSQIYHIVRGAMGFSELEEMCAWEADEAVFYENFTGKLEEICDENFLTTGEKEYWMKKAQAIEKPLIFGYADGYWKLMHSSYPISFYALFFCAICLSELFTKEHTLRTDQLILSSRFGKNQMYWAKTAAGMSFVGISVLLMEIIVTAVALSIYGADGFSVMIQIGAGAYPLPLKAGHTVIMLFAMVMLTALFISVFVGMLSELLHNGIAVLAVAGSIIMLPAVVKIPSQYRLLAQLWTYLPINLSAPYTEGVFSLRLIPFFGGYLTIWHTAPLVYLLLGALCLYCGMRAYRNYQVGGR